MKVTLIHFAYPPNAGGVEQIVYEQARALKRLGFEVKVLTGSGKDDEIDLVVLKNLQSVENFDPKLQKKILEDNIFDEDFYSLSKEIGQELENHLKDQNVIIVHNMLSVYRNLPFIYAFSEYTKSHPDKKYINWIHDHMMIGAEKIKNEKINQFVSDLLTKPIKNTTYVTISSTFASLLRKVLKGIDIKVILDGVDMRNELEIGEKMWKFIQKYDLLNSSPLFLIPANIIERKNIEYSINVFDKILTEFPSSKLLISGDTSRHKNTSEYYTKLKDLVKNLGLSSNVLFLKEEFKEPRSEKDLNDLYKICDAVFYFSNSENFGLPILEATLWKTPIFLSDLKVFKEIGGSNFPYFNVREEAPEKTAKEIIEYLANDKGFLMRRDVKLNYNMETILKKNLIPLISG